MTLDQKIRLLRIAILVGIPLAAMLLGLAVRPMDPIGGGLPPH